MFGVDRSGSIIVSWRSCACSTCTAAPRHAFGLFYGLAVISVRVFRISNYAIWGLSMAADTYTDNRLDSIRDPHTMGQPVPVL